MYNYDPNNPPNVHLSLYISNFIADLDYHLPAIHTQATTQTTKRWRIWRVLVVVVSKAPLPNGSGMV